MIREGGTLHIGFLDDFKGGPAVLTIGGAEAFLWLVDRIASRSTGALSLFFPRVRMMGVDLHLSFGERGELRQCGKDFYWTLSESEVRRFVDMLNVLAVSAGPGHQYLDTPGENAVLQVVASKDEYDPAMFSSEIA